MQYLVFVRNKAFAVVWRAKPDRFVLCRMGNTPAIDFYRGDRYVATLAANDTRRTNLPIDEMFELGRTSA